VVFCSGCGTELPSPNADVCTHCGRFTKEQLRSIADENKLRKRSAWWYLLPIFFSVVGGVIAYFIVKENDPKLARNCLILGLLITLVGFVFGFLLGMFFSPMMMFHSISV
jgi:hypothetical protein